MALSLLRLPQKYFPSHTLTDLEYFSSRLNDQIILIAVVHKSLHLSHVTQALSPPNQLLNEHNFS